MAQQELLIRLVGAAEKADVEYMLTGSIVSSLQGEPRSTHDIDVIVVLKEESVQRLLDEFPLPDYYFDEQMMRDAMKRQSVCSLLDQQSGDKVDLWMLTAEPFDQSRFRRKKVEEVFGIKAYVSSPEDTILQKLRWSEMSGGSDRQFCDAMSVFELQFALLDFAYLQEWASQLNLEKLWKRLRDEAHPLK